MLKIDLDGMEQISLQKTFINHKKSLTGIFFQLPEVESRNH